MLSQAVISESDSRQAPAFSSRTSGKRRNRKWTCTIGESLIGDYLAIPLTSEKRLKSEGYVMNNCSREYTMKCAALEYCIFSIRRRTGERLATLGLSYDFGYWRVDQCFGPSNTEVMEEICAFLDEDGVLQTETFATELYYVAQEVARLLNAAAG